MCGSLFACPSYRHLNLLLQDEIFDLLTELLTLRDMLGCLIQDVCVDQMDLLGTLVVLVVLTKMLQVWWQELCVVTKLLQDPIVFQVFHDPQIQQRLLLALNLLLLGVVELTIVLEERHLVSALVFAET